MTTHTQPVTTARPSTGRLRVFSMLNALVLLGVLLQGLWAGGLIGHLGKTWLVLHEITGNLVVILALAAAVLAVIGLRRHRDLVVWSATLFVLLIAQSGLGEGIKSASPLVVIHVPLAMLIMGLSVYLSIAAARSRRATT